MLVGAHGTVGTAITDHLGDDERYDFTLLDVEDPEEETPHRSVVADVRDYEAVRAVAASSGSDDWPGSGRPDARPVYPAGAHTLFSPEANVPA